MPLVGSALCFLSAVGVHLQKEYGNTTGLLLLQWIPDLGCRVAILWFSYAQVDHLMREKRWIILYAGLTFITLVVSWAFIIVGVFNTEDTTYASDSILIYMSSSMLTTFLNMYIGYVVLVLILKKKRATTKQVAAKILNGPGGTILFSCAVGITSLIIESLHADVDWMYYEILLATRICMLQIFNMKLTAVMQKRADEKHAMQKVNAGRKLDDPSDSPGNGLADNEPVQIVQIKQPMYEEKILPRIDSSKEKELRVVVKSTDNINAFSKSPKKIPIENSKQTGGQRTRSPSSIKVDQSSPVTGSRNAALTSSTSHNAVEPFINKKLLDEDTNLTRRKNQLEITTFKIQVKGKGNFVESGNNPQATPASLRAAKNLKAKNLSQALGTVTAGKLERNKYLTLESALGQPPSSLSKSESGTDSQQSQSPVSVEDKLIVEMPAFNHQSKITEKSTAVPEALPTISRDFIESNHGKRFNTETEKQISGTLERQSDTPVQNTDKNDLVLQEAIIQLIDNQVVKSQEADTTMQPTPDPKTTVATPEILVNPIVQAIKCRSSIKSSPNMGFPEDPESAGAREPKRTTKTVGFTPSPHDEKNTFNSM